MLSRESLIEQAKINNMPQNKMRGIMREYIQTIMLKIFYLSGWSSKFYFLGGTCLRLAFGFRRFSEDLHFNVKDVNTLEAEPMTISSFGEIFPVNVMSKGAMFAEKMDALRHIKKGRHIYDIVNMLSKRFPINKDMLKAAGIAKEPKEAILEIINEFGAEELKRLAKSLAPFLFDEKEILLVENAKVIIKDLLDKYYP